MMINIKTYIWVIAFVAISGSAFFLHTRSASQAETPETPAARVTLLPWVSLTRLATSVGSPAEPVPPQKPVPPPDLTEFFDGFDGSVTIPEAGSEGESTSPYWWVISGGYFIIQGGVGETHHGTLPQG